MPAYCPDAASRRTSSGISAILNEPDVDGVLVGGASLDAAEFAKIAGFEQPRTAVPAS